jgi:MFS transporter, putative metabolite:H+ symporter
VTAAARSGRPSGAITFAHPGAFWFGVTACAVGVLLHLPMYWSTRSMGFRMAGMTPDPAMLIGMALILVGLAASVYGLVPRMARTRPAPGARPVVHAMDDAPLTLRHICVLLVLAAAVTIDVMKPTTLAFVQPGMAKEYGLRSALTPHASGLPVALLPLCGIGGTVVGSLIWGWLGDRIGRRASILLAAVLFTTTAICGAMPGFSWNLLMCFLMGLGAGGLLPLTFTLLAEIIPARHRGWAMVLVGADAAAAYILTSWLAGWLAPHYSWRILWLIGLPTGLLLVVLNRWIPESPLFLLSQGRPDEAKVILEQYGAEIIEDPGSAPPSQRGSYWQLIRRPFAGVAAGIGVSAIGVGLITYGFQLWLPTNLQEIGFTGVTAAKVLRNSALLGFPLTLLAAWLYGFWSSKKTIFALSVVTIAALIGLALAPTSHAVLQAMLAIPIATTGSLAAVLAAYGAEIYPTRIRARATGMAAGASKVGGVIIIALVAASLAIPSLATTALLGVIPLAAAIVLIAVSGRETRGQRLDAIVPVASPETAVPLT